MIYFTFGHNVFISVLLLLHQNASVGGKWLINLNISQHTIPLLYEHTHE